MNHIITKGFSLMVEISFNWPLRLCNWNKKGYCVVLDVYIRVFFLVCMFCDSGYNLLILALLVAI